MIAKNNQRNLIFWIGMISFMAGIMTLFIYTQYRRQQMIELKHISGTFLSQPRAMIPFSLTDTDGKPATNQQLQGRWTFLFFGFTHCHMICPTTMSQLARMVAVLRQHQIDELPHVIMVTINPQRDTAQVLKTYVESFNRDFTGLTGDPAELKSMAKQLGIAVLPAKQDQFDHSGTLVLLNPHGEVFAYFSMPHQGEVLAQDFEKILKLSRL